jgi:hypothetical protein
MKHTPFETYAMYLALKAHFTQKGYDYVKYNGTMKNVKPETFEKRNDRYFFQKLAKKYSTDEMRDFMIANIVAGRTWVGEMLDNAADDTYKAFLKRKESLTYTVLNEVESALNEVTSATELFSAGEGEYPLILMKNLDGSMGYESLIVLDAFVNYTDKFDAVYGSDDVVWGKIRFTLQKLRPFVEYDRTRMKTGLSKLLLN